MTLAFFIDYALQAHWIIFCLFILAGFNLPISEDFLIISAGVIASTLVPENTWKLFTAVFLGAYLSDWMAYWIARKLGPNLWKWRWFARMVSKKKIEQMQSYYNKYGMVTLLIGRFIPFGVRNCLFITAGISQMNFLKFILADGIACIISNSVLFAITFYSGKNYELLLQHLKIINIVLFVVFVIALILFFWYKKGKKHEVDF